MTKDRAGKILSTRLEVSEKDQDARIVEVGNHSSRGRLPGVGCRRAWRFSGRQRQVKVGKDNAIALELESQQRVGDCRFRLRREQPGVQILLNETHDLPLTLRLLLCSLHLFAPHRADDQDTEDHSGEQDHQREEQNDLPAPMQARNVHTDREV